MSLLLVCRETDKHRGQPGGGKLPELPHMAQPHVQAPGGLMLDFSSTAAPVPLEGGHDPAAAYPPQHDPDEAKDAIDAARAMYAGAYGPAAALAQSRQEEQQHYENVRDVELLDVRTRQLKALQADYLRLHEHTLQSAQFYAEQQQAQQEQVRRAEAAREKMKDLLDESRARQTSAKPEIDAALAGCEKMLSRLAAVRSVEQLP